MFKILRNFQQPKMRNQNDLSTCRRYVLSTFEKVNRFKAKKVLNFFISQPPGEEYCPTSFDNFQNVDKEEFLSTKLSTSEMSTNVVGDGCDSSFRSIQNENLVCRSSSSVDNKITSTISSHVELSTLLAKESECSITSTGSRVDKDIEVNRKMSDPRIVSFANSTKMSTQTDIVDKSQKLLKVSSFSLHLFILSFVLIFQNCFTCANAKAKSDIKGREDNGTDIEGNPELPHSREH